MAMPVKKEGDLYLCQSCGDVIADPWESLVRCEECRIEKEHGFIGPPNVKRKSMKYCRSERRMCKPVKDVEKSPGRTRP